MFNVLVNTYPLEFEKTGNPLEDRQREEGRERAKHTMVLVPMLSGFEVPIRVKKAALTEGRLRGKARKRGPLFDVCIEVGDGRTEELHGVDGNAVTIVEL